MDRKERSRSLGVYPEITLKRARERRGEIRKQVAECIEPSAARKAEERALTNTFEAVARMDGKASRKLTKQYAFKLQRRLEQRIVPWIGSKPIHKLTAADVLEPLQRIEH